MSIHTCWYGFETVCGYSYDNTNNDNDTNTSTIHNKYCYYYTCNDINDDYYYASICAVVTVCWSHEAYRDVSAPRKRTQRYVYRYKYK